MQHLHLCWQGRMCCLHIIIEAIASPKDEAEAGRLRNLIQRTDTSSAMFAGAEVQYAINAALKDAKRYVL